MVTPYEQAFLVAYDRLRHNKYRRKKDLMRVCFGAGWLAGIVYQKASWASEFGEKVVQEVQRRKTNESIQCEEVKRKANLPTTIFNRNERKSFAKSRKSKQRSNEKIHQA